jgi:hypothetical protein
VYRRKGVARGEAAGVSRDEPAEPEKVHGAGRAILELACTHWHPPESTVGDQDSFWPYNPQVVLADDSVVIEIAVSLRCTCLYPGSR